MHKINDNIIDFGSISVPESWDDITLKVYEDIERYYSDKDKSFDIMEVLHIVLNKDADFIMSLPMEFLEKILDKLQFLLTPPAEKKATNKITINGEEYIINVQSKLKTGEYLATDTMLKADPHNYAAFLAILCRKEGELYDSKFENEIVEERIKLFEQQPVTNVLPIVSFFLHLYLTLNLPTQLSLMVKEEINHTLRHIENLQKNGDLSILSTLSLKRKLRKLIRRINSI